MHAAVQHLVWESRHCTALLQVAAANMGSATSGKPSPQRMSKCCAARGQPRRTRSGRAARSGLGPLQHPALAAARLPTYRHAVETAVETAQHGRMRQRCSMACMLCVSTHRWSAER